MERTKKNGDTNQGSQFGRVLHSGLGLRLVLLPSRLARVGWALQVLAGLCLTVELDSLRPTPSSQLISFGPVIGHAPL